MYWPLLIPCSRIKSPQNVGIERRLLNMCWKIHLTSIFAPDWARKIWSDSGGCWAGCPRSKPGRGPSTSTPGTGLAKAASSALTSTPSSSSTRLSRVSGKHSFLQPWNFLTSIVNRCFHRQTTTSKNQVKRRTERGSNPTALDQLSKTLHRRSWEWTKCRTKSKVARFFRAKASTTGEGQAAPYFLNNIAVTKTLGVLLNLNRTTLVLYSVLGQCI